MGKLARVNAHEAEFKVAADKARVAMAE